MSWQKHVQSDGPHTVTREWVHPEYSERPTHNLMVGHTEPRGTQRAGMVLLTHKQPSGLHDSRGLVLSGGKWMLTGVYPSQTTETHPPSEALQAMIRHYHKQDAGSAAWMPLLDELAEEYPDHFADHVAEHTRARMS